MLNVNVPFPNGGAHTYRVLVLPIFEKSQGADFIGSDAATATGRDEKQGLEPVNQLLTQICKHNKQ
jgi:hypothetical protein